MTKSPRTRRRGGASARRAARAPAALRTGLAPGARLAPDEELAASGKGEGRTLIIACGALAREILFLKKAHGREDVDLHCLPASWHNTPQFIVPGLRERIRQGRAEGYAHIFAAYADCGTGGAIDKMLAEEGVERLPGAHCYAFYSGAEAFMDTIEGDARSFFLTDYLVRHFDALIVRGMMLDAHPELIADYFGNYEKLVYLAQSDDEELTRKAEDAARFLGLAFERRFTGFGDLDIALKVQDSP